MNLDSRIFSGVRCAPPRTPTVRTFAPCGASIGDAFDPDTRLRGKIKEQYNILRLNEPIVRPRKSMSMVGGGRLIQNSRIDDTYPE